MARSFTLGGSGGGGGVGGAADSVFFLADAAFFLPLRPLRFASTTWELAALPTAAAFVLSGVASLRPEENHALSARATRSNFQSVGFIAVESTTVAAHHLQV
jgi:hypothetical protein